MNVDLSEYRALRVWAEMFHDAQQSRIRAENRVRSAPVFPDVFAAELAAAADAEHRIRLALRRQFRRTVPAGVLAWQREATGVGIDLLARLVGHLGHPRVATPAHWEGAGSERKLVPDEPFERTVGQLWQYCGHGRPGRPAKGMSAGELAALGSPTLKMLTHLLAECAIRQPGRTISGDAQRIGAAHTCIGAPDPLDPGQPSTDTHTTRAGVDPSTTPPIAGPTPKHGPAVWPYRQAYETRRHTTAGQLHTSPCVRCGPAGAPADTGSPWNPGHQHADALRIVGKTILRDLWIAAEEAR